jgi:hypothetical protein
MRLNILNFGPEPTVVAEANAQQAFVDILSVDIIKPLATFKVNEQESHLGMHLSDNRQPGRKPQIRQESELRRISRCPPRCLLIMLRIESWSSKRHTSSNITLGNMLAPTMTFSVLRTFQTTGFVVSRTVRMNLSVQNLKTVLPTNFDSLVH